jgi:hypothetical protein
MFILNCANKGKESISMLTRQNLSFALRYALQAGGLAAEAPISRAKY